MKTAHLLETGSYNMMEQKNQIQNRVHQVNKKIVLTMFT